MPASQRTPPPAIPRTGNAIPEPRAWFADEPGVADLRRILDAHLGEGPEPAILRAAFASGDFGPYEEHLARRARRGLPDADADPLRGLVPHLVAALVDEPARLVAALDAAAEFTRRSVAATRDALHAAAGEELRTHAARTERAREEERTRLARELHDELAQQLTATAMDLRWLRPRLQHAAPEVVERLEAAASLVGSLFDVVRRIGTDLRPAVLDDLGLPAAIGWQATDFGRRAGIAVELALDPELDPALTVLDHAASTALFRMFQELLTNVARHAGAGRVVVRLARDEEAVVLEVADDGRGIRREEIDRPGSLGLLGLRERAALHGGSFCIARARGGGTTASVRLPLRGPA